MGDNYSTPTVQGFPFETHRDHDGLEGKDAVMIHALHDSGDKGRLGMEILRDSKDNVERILESKFDLAKNLDQKLDRVEDKLECKLDEIMERVDEHERRRLDRVIKEQDDEIQTLKTRLLILSAGLGPDTLKG